jgi:Tfp pilus assembly protein PilF
VFTAFSSGCAAQSTAEIDESQEEKFQTKAGEGAPPEAAEIRKQLFDDPKNPTLLFKLADAYVKAQDYAMARSIVSRVLEIIPKYPSAEARLGLVLLFMGDTESAQQSFKTALQHNPKEPTALWGLAAMYKHFGFMSKFTSTMALARKAGRPAGPTHPWMNGLN